MLDRVRRTFRQFFNKTRTLNNEPLNKLSLVVVILVDIFILVNVFTGLNDISQWHISPSQAYPCYSEWANYRDKTNTDKDYQFTQSALNYSASYQLSLHQNYKKTDAEHLGSVSPICLQYATYRDSLDTEENQKIITSIKQKQQQIDDLERANQRIRRQYDSTLLEKIAGQPRNQSINTTGAEQAKQQLDQNNLDITRLKSDSSALKSRLLQGTETINLLNFLKDTEKFRAVDQGYDKASFWYPTIQIIFQFLFLLPLIVLALIIHNSAQRKGYGLVALISWHLLVIFLIPLVIKTFEFLQFGAVFQLLLSIISALVGSLLFLISYIYILLIPLAGFGLIKFFQKFIFNPKLQAANRVQKSQCLKCARNLRQQDTHCPHCGYLQYIDCVACQRPTYKHLPYCRECGAAQNSHLSL